MINWQVNPYELLAIIGAALLIYGRLVSLETKMGPLWEDYVARRDRKVAPHHRSTGRGTE